LGVHPVVVTNRCVMASDVVSAVCQNLGVSIPSGSYTQEARTAGATRDSTASTMASDPELMAAFMSSVWSEAGNPVT
jgi:hypothetical protein